MRAYQQRGVIQIVNTFREALAEIAGLLRKNNQAAAARLIADCAEGAQGLRLFIEESEGAGTQTAALLDQFAEAATGPKADLPKKLEKLLTRIEQTALQELKPNKIEIVFFPYKVSMWDSMESIWRAASQDPRCDAFVVPIPYYDRLPDGRLGQMHYEGHEYPDYVPVVDYRSYNLEERYPDAAFVHNPYDEYNHVTSVHPDYYTRKLRDLTDMLCYVPYFVTGSYIADHFCTCPGVIFSHKVFLESERVRELYLRAFNSYARENRIDRRFVSDDKFVVTGSPKYDKVINSTPDEFTLPPAWQKLLTRPDGTMKKAVLYNTSLGAMLQAGPHYIEKLREVLATFKQREDIVLWWRPHPLSETTFSSMLPALRDGYLGVVAQYKQENFGIYDDTPDLHRALCLTSAYFGDSSSLTTMYQLTGKPIMLQVPQIREGASGPWYNVAPCNLCECDGYYWFSARTFNALFRMDKQTFEIKYMGSFPGEPPFAHTGYLDCVAADGKIYFAPFSASAISVYDTRTGAFERIELPSPESAQRSGFPYVKFYKFMKVLRNGEKLYFIPSTYPGLIEHNIYSGETKVIDGWVADVGRVCNGIDNGFFYNGVFDGDSLILPCACANAVLTINISDNSYKLHRFNGENKGYIDICVSDGARWLLPLYGASLARWNHGGNSLTPHVVNQDADAAKGRALFQRVIPLNDNLLLIPLRSESLLRFSPAAGNTSPIDGVKPVNMDSDGADFFSPYQYQHIMACMNGRVFLSTGPDNMFVEYDPATDTTKERALRPSPDDTAKLCDACLNCEGKYESPDDYNMAERPFIGAAEYIDWVADGERAARYIPTRETRGKEMAHADGKAGEAIYAVITREVLGE